MFSGKTKRNRLRGKMEIFSLHLRHLEVLKMRSISTIPLKKPKKLEVVLDGSGEVGKNLLRQLAEPPLGAVNLEHSAVGHVPRHAWEPPFQ